MKTPYRYLIGIAVGVCAGLFLPLGNQITSFIDLGSKISLYLGQYLALPLIFFTLPVAVTQLRRDGKLGRLIFRSVFLVVISSAVLSVLGLIMAWVSSSGRIPVIAGTYTGEMPVKFMDIMKGVFTGDTSYILTLIVPAFILGWHFFHDREVAEPAYNFFDSLSRILYRAESYIMLLMPFMLALLSASALMHTRSVTDFQRYWGFIGIIFGVCAVIVFFIYPFILRISGRSKTPWRDLTGIIGALAGALFSGSPLFNYGNLVRHLKENLNVPRKNAGVTAPFYLMFARGGTAFIAAFSMLTIIRSYSSLEITLFQAAWTVLFAFLVSFALPSSVNMGIAPALIMLGSLYGRGLNDGWLILVPALPLLGMAAAFLDTATGAFLILILNRKLDMEEDDAVSGVRF